MDAYGSHLYLLESLIKTLSPKTVLETGMGFNSSKLFVDRGIYTESIEMQSEDWFFKVSQELSNYSNFKPQLMLGIKGAIEYIKESSFYDLIFVDGHGSNRWEQINVSFTHTNIIVTHDTEAMIYDWRKVMLPLGWVWVDFEEYNPWTAILIKDINLISPLMAYKHTMYNDISNKDYTNRNVIEYYY